MRSAFVKGFIAGVGVLAVLVVVLVALVALSGTGDDGTTQVAPTTTTPETTQPVVKPKPKPKPDPYASLADEFRLERILNGAHGVNVNRDSGTTCEQQNPRRTWYACSVLKGNEDTATGVMVRCTRPVSGGAAVGCTYTRMTARQRCLFGVRSGIPATGGIWDEEAVICRELGVPID